MFYPGGGRDPLKAWKCAGRPIKTISKFVKTSDVAQNRNTTSEVFYNGQIESYPGRKSASGKS